MFNSRLITVSLLLAAMSLVSACNRDRSEQTAASPVAPTAVSALGTSGTPGGPASSPAQPLPRATADELAVQAGAKTPSTVLETPVAYPPQDLVGITAINFPPRNEPYDFRVQLESKYRDGLKRNAVSSFVDIEGSIVWTQEYLRYRLNGCLHAEAVDKVLMQIDGRGVQPVCGQETPGFPPRNQPFDFRLQLEAKYRDGLRRPSTSTFVDTEGDIVWTQEYLRYRVDGCGHFDAVQKVFLQIDGRGIQPPCQLWTRSGQGNTVFDMPTYIRRVHIHGVWNGRDTSNFIVRIGGRLVVNEILRSSIVYDGVHLTTGGVVEIVSSNSIAWTFTEVQ